VCISPATNKWGKALEDLIKYVKKEVNASLNHDEHTHGGQFDRARLQVHCTAWLRGRLAATAARFNFQAITAWECKVDFRLRSWTRRRRWMRGSRRHQCCGSVRLVFPSDLQVFDSDYGYGDGHVMDGDLRVEILLR